MLFNSLEFAIFFPIVTALFFILPHRLRWLLLLFASCFFYMFFKPVYILILAFTIVIDYYAGILIENAETQKKKNRFLLLSLFANISVLAIFKYYNFIGMNINAIFSLAGTNSQIPLLKILLPIGLSFHTFQAMSYTIEVARGNQKAERHFGIYALYVMFYPQLVAGPIERPQNLLHQFHEKKYFDYERVVSGLRLMLVGLFKKVVIADRLSQFADRIGSPHEQTDLGLLIACVFFAFQIYCDFSGYSDIAIGSARVMGFTLMRNFNFPYFAKNITEFWSRWHISLSTWFRDYVYIPLGGNRVTIARRSFNVLVVFLVSGLWHGAAWTFIIWGALHGLATIFELLTRKIRGKVAENTPMPLYNGVSLILTFIFLVVTWTFFRANSLKDAVYVISRLPHAFSGLNAASISKEILIPGTMHYEIVLSFFFIFGLMLFHGTKIYYCVADNFSKQPVFIRWSVYLLAIVVFLLFGVFDKRQFIYFQF